MKKIIFLFVLLLTTPLLVQSEEAEIKVETPGGSFKINAGVPEQAPEKPTVVVEKTTVVQPKGGCGCRLDSGKPCK